MPIVDIEMTNQDSRHLHLAIELCLSSRIDLSKNPPVLISHYCREGDVFNFYSVPSAYRGEGMTYLLPFLVPLDEEQVAQELLRLLTFNYAEYPEKPTDDKLYYKGWHITNKPHGKPISDGFFVFQFRLAWIDV